MQSHPVAPCPRRTASSPQPSVACFLTAGAGHVSFGLGIPAEPTATRLAPRTQRESRMSLGRGAVCGRSRWLMPGSGYIMERRLRLCVVAGHENFAYWLSLCRCVVCWALTVGNDLITHRSPRKNISIRSMRRGLSLPSLLTAAARASASGSPRTRRGCRPSSRTRAVAAPSRCCRHRLHAFVERRRRVPTRRRRPRCARFVLQPADAGAHAHTVGHGARHDLKCSLLLLAKQNADKPVVGASLVQPSDDGAPGGRGGAAGAMVCGVTAHPLFVDKERATRAAPDRGDATPSAS